MHKALGYTFQQLSYEISGSSLFLQLAYTMYGPLCFKLGCLHLVGAVECKSEYSFLP